MQTVDKTIPRPEHPRPDFQRNDWVNLNGVWNFDFDDDDVGEKEVWFLGHEYRKQIIVPFCYQSKLSGIDDQSHHEVVWYQREFTVPSEFKGKRILLHFGAVDYFAKVWLDGKYLGSHKGGYLPFKFDITNHVKADGKTAHSITVRVEDSRSCTQPRGKQNWKDEPFGCWYTPVTGIWQTVWLEAVGMTYVDRVRITPDIDKRTVCFESYLNQVPEDGKLEFTISFEGQLVNKVVTSVQQRWVKLTVDLLTTDKVDAIHYWWPENPNLYDVDIALYEKDTVVDKVATYFGMRKIHCENGWIYLNNTPLYQKLVLDQGYWPDSLLTPPSDEAIVYDIEMTKKLGFNGARKHQKIEDPRYYYWADKLGLLVWGELPSAYDFCTDWSHQLSPIYKDVDQLVKGAPNKFRSLFAKGYEYKGQPILCTEYGGIAFKKDSGGGNWGYHEAVEDEEEFLRRFEDITRAFRSMEYIRGYCYTQLTDVFNEVNGLLDMNRKPKVDIEKIARINSYMAR